MKALFLAGGMGTRLREMTKQLPKPMIPIFSKPLLARNIARLKEFGVDEVVLSTCYMPDKIRDYFGDGSGLGIKIDYVHEETPLSTGGAIRNAAAKFDDTFLVFNGDIVSGIDLGRMLSFHKAHFNQRFLERCADGKSLRNNPEMYIMVEAIYRKDIFFERELIPWPY